MEEKNNCPLILVLVSPSCLYSEIIVDRLKKAIEDLEITKAIPHETINNGGVSGGNGSPFATMSPAPLPEPLTKREIHVLGLMAENDTYSEIAEKLVISIHTVKTHAKSIRRKLGVSNRREAVKRARELGLIT